MITLLGLAVGFVISVLTLYVVVELFGTAKADLETVAAAALIMTVVGFVFAFIPVVGWIMALIINIYVVASVMDCSALVAFFAIIIWGGLQKLVGMGLGLSLGLF